MADSRRKKRMARGGLFALLAVGLLLIISAAPALATPHETSLAARADQSRISWGASVLVSAVLMDTDATIALGGQSVSLESSADGKSDWAQLAMLTTDEGTYALGQYQTMVRPQKTTYYRFVYAGTPTYSGSTSNVIRIAVKPLLGRPSVPKSTRVGRRFNVTGTLKPAFRAGAKTVTVRVYRYASKKWRIYRVCSARNVDYRGFTKYSLRLRLTQKGRYRCKARIGASSSYAVVTSTMSRTIRVK